MDSQMGNIKNSKALEEFLIKAEKLSGKMDEKNEMSRELIEDAGDLGLLSRKPEGEEFYRTVVEIARRNQSLALSIVASSMVLVEFGDYTGRLHAFAVTEPESGSDLKVCKTRIRNGKVYGVKTLITNAELAEDFAVLAVDEDRDKLKLCLVERSGVSVRKLNVSSFRGSGIGVVRFEGARVVDEADGLKAVMNTLNFSRPFFSAIALGISERCLEEAINYARRRKAFGKPVLEYQGISFQLAECVAEIEALRALIEKAIKSRGETQISAICKLFAAKTVKKVTDVCLQVIAGHGLVKGCYVERAYRDAKAFDVGEGTSEIMKLIISRSF